MADERRVPDLSVVVPSVNGWADLEGCLAALTRQQGDAALEIIVADRVGSDVRTPLAALYPAVRLLPAAPGTSIPALRAEAFRAASADVVGVIEDHVIVPPNWAEQMLRAHGEGAEVVGGSVDNAARERLVDWAAFLCEYSHCLTPPTGAAEWVTGNNVTYRRHLLDRFRAAVDGTRWEDHLHRTMRQGGVTLWSRPEIRVGHKKHYTVGEYLHQRYLYARAYAGARLEGAGAMRRVGYGIAAAALPPILLCRIILRVRRAGVHRGKLLLSLPLLGVFVTAWATGEIVGYWRGQGDTLAKVC